ncbi:hypothetical protein [Brenneria izbisi]|uniref:Outer membrane assembly lipoprotein YfiO n=1 Tax=Brenneria izbisi TaxID=2939450 RepID=A0AA42C631_9GAMM|nr:hypothetical protein [Brenneria izbisi]MCV9879864.1 hypothetical protein [Brenneria izbisi]MCV9883253.1 hypothetical protein [Brenneria izbisi]
MKGVTLLAGVLSVLFSSPAFSSADGLCGFSDAECGIPALPYLLPDNDTRVNLMLLQSSRRPIELPLPQPLPDQTHTRIDPFTAYRVMGLAATEGPSQPVTPAPGITPLQQKAQRLHLSPAVQNTLGALMPGEGEGRQISNDVSTVEAFFDVLLADQQLTDSQRTPLALARMNMLSPDYTASALSAELASVPDEGHAGSLKHYLVNAQAFYEGKFDQAEHGFQSLTQGIQPWVAETARYMLIRVKINQSMQHALDEYNMFDASKADKQAGLAAIQRIDDYLKQYPRGLYRDSAQGLYRRAYWIIGDVNALPKTYQQALGKTDNVADLQALSDEIDNKLLENSTFITTAESPMLMLVQDLKRLRANDGRTNLPALSADALSAQQPLFDNADMQTEFRYLQAALQFYGQKDYTAVVNLIPVTDERDLTDTIRFSLQVLRGQALQRQSRWDEAETHWRRLLTLKTDYTQQQFLQLALAETWVNAGHPERIFAADSPVKNLRFRSAILKVSADADLLRQQTGPQQTHEERAIALHTLLTKSLTHRDYAGYLQDSALRKAIAPLKSAENSRWDQENLAVFDWDGSDTESGYQCPTLDSVVNTLNQHAKDARAINCLGEFFLRTGNSVGFDWGESNMLDGLTNAPTQFKGREYNRLDGYMQVIADANALSEDKSYALYRAVYCYAPSGYNDCGQQDIGKATRKAWFTRLKTEFKGSVWADRLKYYW